MREVLTRKAFTAVDTLLSSGRAVARRALGAARQNGQRYVDLQDRAWATDIALSRQMLRNMQQAKWGDLLWGEDWASGQVPLIHWKGVPNIKDPYDLALVPLLLSELKPATVLELGSYVGGSALWMVDLLESFGVDSQIVSFDIDISRVVVEHPRIQFVQADCTKPSTFDGPWFDLPHPWLVIEDAHVNTYEMLEHFHPHLRPGDYLIVEDTAFMIDKYQALERFAGNHAGDYKVDTRFTDLWGYNGTFSFNGYLRRM
ncbi:Cephalosporin hydroxylase [Mycolicibacterium rutilum]|uniref:Cephalosporin hydroxylase n=1 Tax=Mycolicibacterium rutilum TaxID=370526 RepID=A0A1H6M0R8_MYCRU|nr:CmcI family methyltransferase [Mycolicibacterium rutilum]SEH90967.1 Cephalosporin hydroxylase [Mycolicibacterium rutilum]